MSHRQVDGSRTNSCTSELRRESATNIHEYSQWAWPRNCVFSVHHLPRYPSCASSSESSEGWKKDESSHINSPITFRDMIPLILLLLLTIDANNAMDVPQCSGRLGYRRSYKYSLITDELSYRTEKEATLGSPGSLSTATSQPEKELARPSGHQGESSGLVSIAIPGEPVEPRTKSSTMRSMSQKAMLLEESSNSQLASLKPDDCRICWDGFEENSIDIYYWAICKHKYHESCVDNWLRKSGTCPLCRRLVSGELAPEQLALDLLPEHGSPRSDYSDLSNQEVFPDLEPRITIHNPDRPKLIYDVMAVMSLIVFLCFMVRLSLAQVPSSSPLHHWL
ncbi:hypothetical protein PSHT_00501 [Puccinia striiformis]|uniref:RING-type domain-containing protein n=1 Tax=Puccinia striiformis TaxID=27350 RepID=A0A2S4WMV0_9BASI|nr:hypothetical protein PSHT_00501 [Puccinia striiformis]